MLHPKSLTHAPEISADPFFVSLSDDLKTKMTIRVQIIAITFRRVVSSSELSNDTTPSLVF